MQLIAYLIYSWVCFFTLAISNENFSFMYPNLLFSVQREALNYYPSIFMVKVAPSLALFFQIHFHFIYWGLPRDRKYQLQIIILPPPLQRLCPFLYLFFPSSKCAHKNTDSQC